MPEIKWPIRPPEKIFRDDDPLPRLQVRKLSLAPKPVAIKQIILAAQIIYNTYPPSGTFNQQLQHFMDLTYHIGLLQKEVESESNSGVVNAITHVLAELTAADLPRQADGERRIHDLELACDRATDLNHWFTAKLNALWTRYHERLEVLNTLEKVFPADPTALTAARANRIESDADTLTQTIHELRSYGVKTCLFNDGAMRPPGCSWVFLDPSFPKDIEATLGFNYTPKLAWIALAPHARKVDYSERREIVDPQYGEVTRYEFGFGSHFFMGVADSGELMAGNTFGMIPIKRHFEEADREAFYPQFRLSHLARLFDLVVSIETMRPSAPNWSSLPKRAGHGTVREIDDWLRPLVLPRVRLARDPDRLREGIEEELRLSRLLTGELTVRAKHDITGFLRPLPQGCRATDRARQLAYEERRITTIPDGYTYVKDHDRGTGPRKIRGHVARRRPRPDADNQPREE